MSTPMSSLEESTKFCPACETRVPAEAAACDICGHVFGAWQPAPTAAETPVRPPMPEPDAESATGPAPSSPEPQPARPELAALKSADGLSSPAIPSRRAWLIGLALSSVVLLLSLAVMVLRPQLGALATAPPPTAVPGRVIGAVPSVALRSGAATQFAVLRQLPPGQSVVMECQIRGSVPAAFAPDGSDKWVRASVDGVSGYIYSALLETGGRLIDCSTTQ